ncbi:MAG: hypothetical protein OSA99_13245 [Acidimicrobiales bacterium]|nr:hypothetical protein [Acidimicrobiales bacterium]
MIDLLLPRTDAGAAVQAAVAFVVFVGALLAVRRNPDLRLFVYGLGTITAAWFALRTVH